MDDAASGLDTSKTRTALLCVPGTDWMSCCSCADSFLQHVCMRTGSVLVLVSNKNSSIAPQNFAGASPQGRSSCRSLQETCQTGRVVPHPAVRSDCCQVPEGLLQARLGPIVQAHFSYACGEGSSFALWTGDQSLHNCTAHR